MFQVWEFPFIQAHFFSPGMANIWKKFSRNSRKILVHGKFGIQESFEFWDSPSIPQFHKDPLSSTYRFQTTTTSFQHVKSLSSTPKTPQFNTKISLSSKPKTSQFNTENPSVPHRKSPVLHTPQFHFKTSQFHTAYIERFFVKEVWWTGGFWCGTEGG